MKNNRPKNTAEFNFPYQEVVKAYVEMASSSTHYSTNTAHTPGHFKAITTS